MNVSKSCFKEKPFEVGDRVVGINMKGKSVGTIILPRLTGKIRSCLGDGYYSSNVYAVKFDDGTYRHMGESALEFEKD